MPRPILTLPDTRLRRPSVPIQTFDRSLRALLAELEAAMRAGPGGVGVAAPQLGENVRAIVVDCRRARHPCHNHGFLHMVNPSFSVCDDTHVLGREGCLSVPDWTGLVPRFRCVRVRFQDGEGIVHELGSSGFEARVIQHEVDHLDGILFIDRVVSTHDLVRRMG